MTDKATERAREITIEQFNIDLQHALHEAVKRLRVAKEALKFYAREDNWTSGDAPMRVYALDDKGHRARQAFKLLGEA